MKQLAFLADNLEGMKMFRDKHFDLAIIDPPYGINAPLMNMGANKERTSTAKRLKGRLNSGGGKLKNRLLNTSEFDWDNQVPSIEFFKELFRVSKHQIIFGGNYFELPPSRCIVCWDKLQPWENFSQWEMAWTSFDKPAKMYRISTRGGANKEEKIHPTQKPVLLYRKLLRDFASPGFKILDTHLGSGSSRIACLLDGFDFVGFENNERYFQDQQRRFENEYKLYTLTPVLLFPE